MKVYSLSGKSGTGKSYRALDLQEKYNIDAIIDDGLLIFNGRIIAGKSAKRQSTTIRAIKTALFQEDSHKNEVVRELKKHDINSILVIGTSERMVDIISNRLEIPIPETRIYIESITTEEERALANMHRNELGEHIIPAPTMEIKQDFSGYFIHPLKRFKDFYNDGREGRWDSPKDSKERSVVRPTFSYLGRYYISERTIVDIINIVASKMPELNSISTAYIQLKPNGVIIDIEIVVNFGHPIVDVAKNLQSEVAKMVDDMTSLNILAVDVKIDGLMWGEDVRSNKIRR